MDTSLSMWAIFLSVVFFLLILDLGLMHRSDKEIGVKESLKLSLFYIVMGCLFGVFVWFQEGAQKGSEFFTGFLIEKSLSLDNIFVISLVFSFFGIPRKLQYRVLFWGILGVIILRGIMIGLGAALVAEFHWVLYIFAAFLIYTGIKMLFAADDDEKPDFEKSRIFKFLKSHLRVTQELHGNKFFVRLPDPKHPEKKINWCTPLFICLLFVECADLIFAVDSVPAIFAITTDPYIVYTSNIFAILGLRALYFALSAILHRFEYLKYALSVVLVFIGSKIFIADFILGGKFPASISLGVTVALLAAGVIFSLYKTRGKAKAEDAH